MEDGVGVGGNVLERPPTELDAASRFCWELKSRKKSERPTKKSEEKEEKEEEEEETPTKNRLLVILLLHSRRRRCLLCSIFMDKYKYKQLQIFLDK